MKQAKKMGLWPFHTDESLGYLELIVEKSSYISVEADQASISLFEDAVNTFSMAWKQNKKNSHTQKRKEADRIVDDTYIGMRSFVDSVMHFNNPANKDIATRANAIIEKYGTITEMGYKQKYPGIRSLIDDLLEIGNEDLTKIGLNVCIDALESAYDVFMKATADKNAEDGARVKGIVQTTRKEAEAAYAMLIQRINAGAVYNGDEPYVLFIDSVNAQIDEYKTMLSSRKTRAANKKDEDSKDDNPADTSNDPDLPADMP